MTKLFIVVEYRQSYDKDMDVLGVFETKELAEKAIEEVFGDTYTYMSLKQKMEHHGLDITELELNKYGFII
jgi:hypothetical protein